MPRALLLVVLLALISCACTTKPSAIPAAVLCPKTPVPPELTTLADPPPPLAPDYFQTDP